MYKKIVFYLVFSLFAPLVALCAEDPNRVRLYIPVSTNATVGGCATCEVKASGYSARYVFGFGLGLGLTSSKATVTGTTGDIGDYSYDTGPMIDIGYTFGSDFTFTLGLGVGGSPSSDIKIPSDSSYKIEGKSASSFFLGLGYNLGPVEILLALRSLSATYDQTISFFGMPVTSEVNPTWMTTDIGIGYTF